ncbi:MAG: hypothetical protein OXM02_00960 [Bacteroidota bacterium]|nr:hypothetical protein [Bacteroidota bacterium]MDE2955414.1 hypothetical protein [Bacteroidota bacterium]
MLKSYFFPLLLIAAMLAGCAGSRQAQAPHPLVGNWAYSLDTPQGVYTGTIVFSESDEVLAGTIGMDDSPVGDTMAMEELVFDSETMQVSYTFDSGEFGVMSVTLTLDGDSLDGLMTVHQFGIDVPLVAQREVDE